MNVSKVTSCPYTTSCMLPSRSVALIGGLLQQVPDLRGHHHAWIKGNCCDRTGSWRNEDLVSRSCYFVSSFLRMFVCLFLRCCVSFMPFFLFLSFLTLSFFVLGFFIFFISRLPLYRYLFSSPPISPHNMLCN